VVVKRGFLVERVSVSVVYLCIIFAWCMNIKDEDEEDDDAGPQPQLEIE
jgi:hypothetical protein